MNVPDPYKVLQVDHEAEDEVIEAAYRRLARKYHPDVATGPDAQERMVRINQAWELLRDPVRRAAVDRARLRTEGSTARAAAAEARTRTTASGYRATAPAEGHGQAGPPPRTPGFPGAHDPSASARGARTDFVSPDWTTGRSDAGYRYDPATMGAGQAEGAAGPPPGSPSGSVLNFGRYAGWSLGEIARVDLEYLEWLDRTPIGRTYQGEIDALLRARSRRVTASESSPGQRGLFRRR